jgi:hypothetical protein
MSEVVEQPTPTVVFKKRKRPNSKGQKRSLAAIANESADNDANVVADTNGTEPQSEGTAVVKKSRQFGKGLVQKTVKKKKLV